MVRMQISLEVSGKKVKEVLLISSVTEALLVALGIQWSIKTDKILS